CSWTITGGVPLTSVNECCIQVRAGDGAILVASVTVTRPGCSTTCEKRVTLGNPVCTVQQMGPPRTLTCRDTASFCAGVTPPGGSVTYGWTITPGGGAILTDPTASCVKVRID